MGKREIHEIGLEESYVISCLNNNEDIALSASHAAQADLDRFARQVVSNVSWRDAAALLCKRLFQRTGQIALNEMQRQRALNKFIEVVSSLAAEAHSAKGSYDETRISLVEAALERPLCMVSMAAERGEKLTSEALKTFEFLVEQIEKLQPNSPSSQYLSDYRACFPQAAVA